jgi:hypothetical protein
MQKEPLLVPNTIYYIITKSQKNRGIFAILWNFVVELVEKLCQDLAAVQSWASYFIHIKESSTPPFSLSLKAQEHRESLTKSSKVVIQNLMLYLLLNNLCIFPGFST